MQSSWTAISWSDVLNLLEVWGGWITLASFLLLLVTLVLTPFLVVRIPVDYFSHPERHSLRRGHRHPIIKAMAIGLKNLLGAVLLLAGFIMLFGPGPGLITLFFGFYLMNFPGKYRLECWLIHRPMVLRHVNAMRKKRGRPPLQPAIRKPFGSA